jgi:energy-coupling factor transport system substrate-specific component
MMPSLKKDEWRYAMKALGMIEVYGYVVAIEALDSALKAANVNLIDMTLVRGGLVTVLITGEVGAVKAAMDASKTAAERLGKVISVHVIPRPSKEIEKIIPLRPTGIESSPVISKTGTTQLNEISREQINREQIKPDMLQGMTVEHLRSLARDLGITNMTRKQIRFASKHELIESISKFIEQER